MYGFVTFCFVVGGGGGGLFPSFLLLCSVFYELGIRFPKSVSYHL